MLRRLVAPKLTFFFFFFTGVIMACNRFMKLFGELNKISSFPPLSQMNNLVAVSRAGIAVALLVFLASGTPSPVLLPYELSRTT